MTPFLLRAWHFATAACFLAGATLAAPPDAATLRTQADALLAARVQAAGPGVAVLVARGETVLLRSARGMASIELGVPLSPDHAFRIGSVTKQFSAAALLREVDAGRARLDDPLSKYLPDYPGGQAITLQLLLNHTSGVRSYTNIPGYMTGPIRRELTTAQLIAEFKDRPVDFPPGTAWAYNNSGYVLVGAVLEAITRQPWHTGVTAMTQALGVKGIAFGDERAVRPGMADGYSSGPGQPPQRADFISMSQPHAAGALVGSVDDLWLWNLALHGGRVLSADSYRRMTVPEGEPAQRVRYGFGIGTGSVRGRPALLHSGGIHGYLSMLVWLPSERMTVAVLRNSDGPGLDPGMLARELAALALGDPYPDGAAVAVPAAELQALAGRWRRADGSGPDDERLLRLQGGTLTSQRGGGAPLRLKPIGGGVFLFENSISRIQVQGTTLRFFADGEGEGEVWTRTGDLPPERASIALTPEQAQALVGEYSSPAFSFRVFVDAQGVLRGQAPGQAALQLHAETPRQLYVKEVGASLAFEPDAGPVTQVTLTQGRNQLKMPRKTP
jgi:CubicO group peptidase (beta-lactamase class C family)